VRSDAPDPGFAEGELTSGAHDNFVDFAANHLKIQTKSGEMVPFVLNRSQQLREQLFSEIEAAGLPIRIWEAKARQLGCSTHIQGRQFWKTVTNYDESALVAAHADAASRAIFTKCKTFYDYMPEELRPQQKYNNRTELDLRAPRGPGGLRSSFEVMTARSVEDARGRTSRQLHVSEVAFFKAPEKYFLATLQTVPDEPGTMVYVESTCNGSGDFHHEMYLAARCWWDEPPPWQKLKRTHPGNPDSGWIAFFSPWFLMDSYRSALRTGREEFTKSLDVDEQELLREFDGYITLEHLQWRRQTIATKCGGSVDQFHQEYPSSDEEAFAATGSPVFDREDLEVQIKLHGCHCDMCRTVTDRVDEANDCPDHQWFELSDMTGSVRGERTWNFYKPLLAPAPAGHGRMSQWEAPVPGERYVVAADVSKGTIGGDWDHLTVMRIRDRTQVAEWRGKIELHELCDICLLLAIYYNQAVLAPEVTGIGAGLIAMLERTRYPMLYRRTVMDAVGGPTVMLGWDTSKKTKPAMVGLMQRALADRFVVLRSRVVLEEMWIYRKKLLFSPDGHESNDAAMAAPVGRHDDAVISALIAGAVSHYSPGGRPAVQRRKDIKELFDSSTYTEEDWERMEARNQNQGRGSTGWMLNRALRKL